MFVRYKNTQLSGLKFIIFISHKRSRVSTRYFTRLCIIILSICVIFLVNLDDFFAVIYMSFHEDCGFHPIYSLWRSCQWCNTSLIWMLGLIVIPSLISDLHTYSWCHGSSPLRMHSHNVSPLFSSIDMHAPILVGWWPIRWWLEDVEAL